MSFKQSTLSIAAKFPFFLEPLSNDEEPFASFSEEEKVFYELARFFEEPNSRCFDFALLYKYLEGQWLLFALECLHEFFRQDTYLLPNNPVLIIQDSINPLMNQTSFAKILAEKGFPFDLKKLNVYKKRGMLPEPDVLIENIPYWKKSTIEKYIEQLEVAKI